MKKVKNVLLLMGFLNWNINIYNNTLKKKEIGGYHIFFYTLVILVIL